MRRLACCVVVVTVCALGARPALAGWGKSTWGMSPEDAAAAARAGGEEVSASGMCPRPWTTDQHQDLLATTSTTGAWRYAHSYWFARDGLAIVVTRALARPSGITAEAECEQRKQELTAQYGEPRATGDAAFDWTWDGADRPDVLRLMRVQDSCELWTAVPAFAATGYRTSSSDEYCHGALSLGENRGDTLSSGVGTCVSSENQLFAIRRLRIEAPQDLHLELTMAKPGALHVYDVDGRGLAEAQTAAEPEIDNVARARVSVTPGCYFVQVSTSGEKVRSDYRIDVEPYAAWKENADLWREEQLGEEGDTGPPTARHPAIIMGAVPAGPRRTHLHTSAAIAFVDDGNLYGASTSLGFELNRHARVRGIIGGTAAVMVQPIGGEFATTNTMFPVALWGGARVRAHDKVAVTARAGVLGYYIAADADEMVIGGIDRSDHGGGYVFALDVALGAAVLGVERWLLGEAVTSLRLGVGF